MCEDRYLGVGIYSIPEAARLSGVSSSRIARWIRGYTYKYGEERRSSPPLWQRELPEVDGRYSLGFRDLIEVRFVDAFRTHGVSWKTIRKAASRASELFGIDHPFSARRFVTDGRRIFADVYDEEGDKALLDLLDRQLTFRRFLLPYLKGLEFEDDLRVVRWWPMDSKHRVVVDPTRAFGQPIVANSGVPTRILAESYQSVGSVEAVAEWYDVDRQSVREAVEFEDRLAA